MPESAAPPNPSSDASARDSRARTRKFALGCLIAIVVFAGFVAGTWLLVRATSSNQASTSGTEALRVPWASAMRKAGVEATLPAEPTDLTSLRGDGSHPFDATFTAEEATALLRIYPFHFEQGGQSADLQGPTIEFPEAGVVQVTGNVMSNGQSLSLQIQGPVTYSLATRLRSPGATSVTAEGFGVSGAQAAQATKLALDYGNAYLAAAPGFTAVKAEIVAGGVHVTGHAPDRLVVK